VLPQVFDGPNYFRIVTTIPQARMKVAMERIVEFALAHATAAAAAT
jgi:hypothetical protein